MVESTDNADAGMTGNYEWTGDHYWYDYDYYHYYSWWCSTCNCYHDNRSPCPQKKTELEYDNSDFMKKMDEMLKILKKIEKKVKS